MIPINRHFISLWVYNLVLICLFVFRMNKVMFLQTTTLLFSEFLKKDRIFLFVQCQSSLHWQTFVVVFMYLAVLVIVAWPFKLSISTAFALH